MSKASEVEQFIRARALEAINDKCADMTNREHAEAIRLNRTGLAYAVAWFVSREYGLLELAEWKRSRVRR